MKPNTKLSTTKTKASLGLTPAQRKRLLVGRPVRHDPREVVLRAYADALAVQNALATWSKQAALKTMRVKAVLDKARDEWAAHHFMLVRENMKRPNTDEVAQKFRDELAKKAGKASAAVDAALEEVKTSNRVIALMERSANRKRQKK